MWKSGNSNFRFDEGVEMKINAKQIVDKHKKAIASRGRLIKKEREWINWVVEKENHAKGS